MRSIDRITALNLQSKGDWKKALNDLADAAERTISGLEKATSDRQIDLRDEAKAMVALVGDTLSWLQYETWPTNPVDDFAAAVSHIKASIKV